MDIAVKRRRGASTCGVRRDQSEPTRISWAGSAPGLKVVNLALQGGGAHGAFAWGVLDRLLEDERIAFQGISATSAGAMNATVLAYGLAVGGREGARRALANFWRRIAHAASMGPLQPIFLDRITSNRSLETSPAFVFFDLLTRLFSPYQLNPLNYNPLRHVLIDTVDFEALRAARCPVKLFLSATNVRTGKIRVFSNDEIGPDAVLASGCLPFIFQAVEIDGESYWDGGYMGNPAIFPLIYNCDSRDVVIVHINPIERKALPKTAGEILNRINEISFNSSLMREMRAIAFVTKLFDDGKINDNSMKRMLIHAIEAEDVMSELSVASKLNPDWEQLTHLKEVGRERGEAWLAAHFDQIGRDSKWAAIFARSTSDALVHEMNRKQILKLPSMPISLPSYPHGPYRFIDREYLIVGYESDPDVMRGALPDPLATDASNTVLYDLHEIDMKTSLIVASAFAAAVASPLMTNAGPRRRRPSRPRSATALPPPAKTTARRLPIPAPASRRRRRPAIPGSTCPPAPA